MIQRFAATAIYDFFGWIASPAVMGGPE